MQPMIFGGDILLSPDLTLLLGVLGSVGLFFVVLQIFDRRRD